MKSFEFAYLFLEPLLPPLYGRIRREMRMLLASGPAAPDILHVGGRKSHYTIGLPGRVTVSDLPRDSETQEQLNLGLTPALAADLQRRRANIAAVVFDDMARSQIPDRSFDGVVAVEVLEHVEEDGQFIRHVHRVLRPGGWFLMSTPNGDFLPNRNPDHKRHYTRSQLAELLARHFPGVNVEYAIRGGRFRRMGLEAWSPRAPFKTAMSMAGNLVNRLQSANARLAEQAAGTHHLLARARKAHA